MTGSSIFFQQLAQAFLSEVPDQKKQDLIMQELAELDKRSLNKLSTITKNLLSILATRGLLKSLKSFLEKLDAVRDRLHIAKRIRITSAEPLENKQRDILQVTLTRAWNTHLVFSEEVDPTLLAGFRLEQDGWMFDASLQGRLKRLQQTLTQSNV